MSPEDLERLATLIAAALEAQGREHGAAQGSWLPVPVRPQPAGPPGEPPLWTGAAQPLGDVAPIRRPIPSPHRDDPGAAAASIRAAAAGKAVTRAHASAAGAPRGTGPRSGARATPRAVPVGVSNRHVHLSPADVAVLFGPAGLQSERSLAQPGQFAAVQRVAVTGPRGRIEGVRVVGPARGHTQLELAVSDAALLGVQPPVLNSGQRAAVAPALALEGPAGRVSLATGVIVAARHLHLAPIDATRWHLADGDIVDVRCGEGPRATTWHGVLVRSGAGHATEFHLDADEARAAGVSSGDTAHVVGRARPSTARRVLVTERDLIALAARGEPVPPGALLTPSARDRARALGVTIP